MSEISHIPICRCSTVSRLDRIRMLWRSMLPQGVWKRQRCVASSSAGRRAVPGPCPVCSVDEASLSCVARRFMTQAFGVSREKEKKKKISKIRNYITSPQVFMVYCSMFVRMIFERLEFVSCFQKYLFFFTSIFYSVNFTWSSKLYR